MTATITASDSLDRSLIRSIAWTSVTTWSSQIVTWIATLVVARLLNPADYGLIGMAALYLGFLTLLHEFGLGTAIIARRELSDHQIAQLNSVAVLFGLSGFALSCLTATLLGRFFGVPELPTVVVAMSLTLIITSFRTVPQSLLEKELRFKLLSLIESGRALVLAVTVVTLALLGFSYWTLVLGHVLGAAISTGLVLANRMHGFAVPSPQSLRLPMMFSGHVIVSRLSWYVYSNADFLIVGRMLGQSTLGAYTMAWQLASIPVEKVTALASRVTPAFFSTVQNDHAALRRYLLLLTGGLALVTFPTTSGLALIADDFVLLALGDKWQAVVAPLRLLAFYAAFRSIIPLLSQVLNVTGESRFAMWNGVVAAAVLPVAFLIGSHWGTVGVATAWIVVHPLLTAPLYWRIFRKLAVSGRQYARAVWPALSAAVMVCAVLLVRLLLPADLPVGSRFIVEVLVGAASYTLAIVLLHRDRLRNLRHFVAVARAGAPAPATPGPQR